MIHRILVFSLLLQSLIACYAQDCSDFHQYQCTYTDYTFTYSEQSQSALFRAGQTQEFIISLKGGYEYYLTVCANRKFGKLGFKIFADNTDRSLIFDNAQENFSESFKFKNSIDCWYIIEVSVPENPKITNERRCVGILIGEKPVNNLVEP